MKSFYFYPLFVFFFIAFTACEKESEISTPATIDDYFELKIDDIPLSVQIAITRSEQKKGLMYRESLPENSGMLFSYKSARQMSFWMANTKIPLDIAFFDKDGILKEIYRLYPNNTTTTKSISDDLHYAIEMEQGWFRSKGLKAGSQLDLNLVAKGLKARGEDISECNLSLD